MAKRDHHKKTDSTKPKVVKESKVALRVRMIADFIRIIQFFLDLF
uniref:Uncharacterized protein n=1 Tax=Exiguobacterium sp. S3-2 TaxID=1389960 RepID=V9Z991_9BACL|nr:hypothetical protein [Exiguobacterium sp. S3-2]AHE40579.1 hypothetical protein [Exiguobacterium sp. S3-2]